MSLPERAARTSLTSLASLASLAPLPSPPRVVEGALDPVEIA